MAIAFDQYYEPPNLSGHVYLRLAKGIASGYKAPGATKLSKIREGPFKILRKVLLLAYELELPKSYRIHPVISVIHLKQAPESDEYKRAVAEPSPLIVDGEEH